MKHLDELYRRGACQHEQVSRLLSCDVSLCVGCMAADDGTQMGLDIGTYTCTRVYIYTLRVMGLLKLRCVGAIYSRDII